ncbi:MAG TPA: ABC transporter ATP-binding protein [Acetobacteraceae bacterium]|nr:ABC transporter ATP-binding protein [Acetobacteraceae bacterium]
MAAIVIDHIGMRFGGTVALDDISLTVADGELVALLGPSGCGKTTLLRIIAGLQTETSGRVLIGERDMSGIPPRRRGLAMVFQNYAVFPHMRVRDNIAFGLRMTGAAAARIERQVARAAGLLHIEPLLDRYPAQLSGGQRQRVAVARALAVEPAVMLMDEPLSNLDALLRLEMRADLKTVLREAGTTTLYVTHDQTEAMGLADRIAVMAQGRIDQVASPSDIYRYPATRFVAGFLGTPPMNFLALPVMDGAVALGNVRLAAPAGATPVVLGVRPEDLVASTELEGFAFTTQVTEPLGAHTLLTGQAEGGLLRVIVPPDLRPAAGSVLFLRPHLDRLSWFDPASGAALEHTA